MATSGIDHSSKATSAVVIKHPARLESLPEKYAAAVVIPSAPTPNRIVAGFWIAAKAPRPSGPRIRASMTPVSRPSKVAAIFTDAVQARSWVKLLLRTIQRSLYLVRSKQKIKSQCLWFNSALSRCSTTGVAATLRSRASRRCSSCRTGSALSLSRTWQHDRRPLEASVRRPS